MSKKLDSILSKVPPATAKTITQSSEKTKTPQITSFIRSEQTAKIVARIPENLKEEIKNYVKNNKGQTETTVVLKGLKLLGFKVQDDLLVDKRTLR